jgi:alanyl-tRNA synthetase
MNVKTHTALHVLKGAVQKVLNARWTAGVWVEGVHGRLTVQYDRKPTEEELRQIEREANQKIQENQCVKEQYIKREEAEALWGDAIYDVFPIPDSVHTLKIVTIEGWNVNACNKDHTKTTGDIGEILLRKARFRGKKQVLEISFSIADET